MNEQPLYSYLEQESLVALLEQQFAAGLSVDGMFTMTDNLELASGLLEPTALEYSAIFLETSYAHLLRASPYLCRLTPTHPFTATLAEKPDEFGFFAWGAETNKEGANHWRRLLNADMPDNTTTHFRFYSALVMGMYIRASNQLEIQRLLGPYAGIAVPISIGEWLCVHNPSLKYISAQELTQSYSRPAVFAVTPEQVAAMEGLRQDDYQLTIVADFFALFEACHQHPPAWLDFDSACNAATRILARLEGEPCPPGKQVEYNFTHAVLTAMEDGATTEQLQRGVDAFCNALPAYEAGLLFFEAICQA